MPGKTNNIESLIGQAYLQGKRKSMEDTGDMRSMPGFNLLNQDEMQSIIKKAFEILETRVEQDPQLPDKTSGSTSITAFSWGNEVYISNLGDSRAYLILCDTKTKKTNVMLLNSEQHDCYNEKEVKRLKDIAIIHRHRVFKEPFTGDSIAITRAFGDNEYNISNNIISHIPEVYYYTTTFEEGTVAYLLLSSDGLVQGIINNPQKEEQFVQKLFENCYLPDQNPTQLANNIANQALAEGSSDNVSVIIQKFYSKGLKDFFSLLNSSSLDKKFFSNLNLNSTSTNELGFSIYDGHGGSKIAEALADQDKGLLAEIEKLMLKQIIENLESFEQEIKFAKPETFKNIGIKIYYLFKFAQEIPEFDFTLLVPIWNAYSEITGTNFLNPWVSFPWASLMNDSSKQNTSSSLNLNSTATVKANKPSKQEQQRQSTPFFKKKDNNTNKKNNIASILNKISGASP